MAWLKDPSQNLHIIERMKMNKIMHLSHVISREIFQAVDFLGRFMKEFVEPIETLVKMKILKVLELALSNVEL